MGATEDPSPPVEPGLIGWEETWKERTGGMRARNKAEQFKGRETVRRIEDNPVGRNIVPLRPIGQKRTRKEE